MTLINGHFWHPEWVGLLSAVGRGKKLSTTKATSASPALAYNTWTRILDKSTGGPYLVLVFNIDPAASYNDSALRIIGDGVTLHERTGIDPINNNYLVGTPFSDFIVNGSIPAVWCNTGFELWGYRTSAGGVYCHYVYYDLAWSAI